MDTLQARATKVSKRNPTAPFVLMEERPITSFNQWSSILKAASDVTSQVKESHQERVRMNKDDWEYILAVALRVKNIGFRIIQLSPDMSLLSVKVYDPHGAYEPIMLIQTPRLTVQIEDAMSIEGLLAKRRNR